MSEKLKVFKNPSREVKEEYTAYTPQYQSLGKEPMIMPPKDIHTSSAAQILKNSPNIAGEQSGSPVTLPNVGNRDYTWAGIDWSGVDSECVGEHKLDINHAMIDNNEFVTSQALGIDNSSPDMQHTATPEDNIINKLYNLVEGFYIVLVNGVAVCSGPLTEVQEQVRLLAFGKHDLCNGDSIPLESIVVLKRAEIKVGLFLE
jgi:hypothetical protein